MSSTNATLWPKPIPIIGGTGEYESGKTIFGLTICPGPQTLYYDFEQSGASYNELGHTRINVMAEMQARYPNGYKPVDLFLWWRDHVKAIPAGQYRVIVIDPATDIERGMTDWVSANPSHFGHTAQQYSKMSGIMWGDLKDYLKSLIADISTRCETLYFTAHVGKEFEGTSATGKLKIKGKVTLMELASAFFWFERKADAKGVKPNKPAAYVKKSRLLVMKADADGEIELQQVLPPKMPICTPAELRKAFATPAGGREIDELEKQVEERMSDDDRLRLEVAKAEAERDAAQARTNGQTTAGKPTEPTGPSIVEVLKWIEEATDAAALLDRLKAANLPAETKSAVWPAYQKKSKELANKPAA